MQLSLYISTSRARRTVSNITSAWGLWRAMPFRRSLRPVRTLSGLRSEKLLWPRMGIKLMLIVSCLGGLNGALSKSVAPFPLILEWIVGSAHGKIIKLKACDQSTTPGHPPASEAHRGAGTHIQYWAGLKETVWGFDAAIMLRNIPTALGLILFR